MALVGTLVECPLRPLQQQAPKTSGPIGRLASLRNAAATKFEGDALKVEQRLGFRQLTKQVINPDPTAWTLVRTDVEGFSATPDVLTSLGNQLVVVADAKPHILAENSSTWAQLQHILQPVPLTMAPLYTSNTTVLCPDNAVIGNVVCRTWKQQNGTHLDAYVSISDIDGTPLRLPMVLGTSSHFNPIQLKVVSDGAYFYVFCSVGTAMKLWIFAPLGNTEVAAYSFTTTDVTVRWDVQYSPALGVTWVGGPDVELFRFTYAVGPGVVATSVNLISTVYPAGTNLRTFFLTNPTDTTHAYFGILFDGVPAPIKVVKVSNASVATVVRVAAMRDSNTDTSCEATGYVDAAGNIHTYTSTRDTSNSVFNATEHSQITPSNVLTHDTLQSTIVGSRTFMLRGRFTQIQYFDDGLQPTYFLYDLASKQYVGTWAHGVASMEWAVDGDVVEGEGSPEGTADSFALTSPFTDLQGNWHTLVAYQAESFFVDTITYQSTGTGKGSITAVDKSVSKSCIGLADVRWGTAPVDAVEYADELFLPGCLANSFTGSVITENNFSLFPSPFVVTQSHSDAGNLQHLGLLSYVVCFSTVDAHGNIVRSRPSDPQLVQMTSTNNINTLAIPVLHCTEGKAAIQVEIYRTFLKAGIPDVPSTQHKMISSPIFPLFNDKAAPYVVTFVDNVTDIQCELGETLYTDQGLLPHDAAPAFVTGCVAGDRVFLLGWDGAIWYSSSKQEGQPLTFNVDVLRQTVPTSDPVKNIKALDSGRLIIFCENSVWEWIIGGLPDPAGLNGNVQAPTRLFATNGCKGRATNIREGIAYDSSAGGVWLLERGLENIQLSAPAVDDLAQHSVVGISTDLDQRTMFGIAGSQSAEIRDGINGVWSKFSLPSQVFQVHQFRGRFCYADATSVRVQEDNLYADVSFEDLGEGGGGHQEVRTPVIMDILTDPIQIGSVKGAKVVWQMLITGEYKAPHKLRIEATYETEDGNVTEDWTLTPDPSEPYVWELDSCVIEISAVTLRFTSDFAGVATPGNSFTLELLSFYVGIDGALVRTPPTVRRGQST